MGRLIKQRNWMSLAVIAVLILIWQIVSMTKLVPGYMLPSPVRVMAAFTADFPLLMRHLWRTL
ncbi:MAG: hypothetical protein LBU66_03550, partial [Treponema sp.]|nr:hypothetical protein [Treponema sp.]